MSKPVRYRFDRGWVGDVAISPAEGLVCFEDFLVAPSCTRSEGVVKKEYSFWRKSAGRGRSWDTYRPRLASFL